jgi:outer membrane protein OmpA-like peptidoglycan-associated protein
MSIAFRVGVLVVLALLCLSVGVFLIGNQNSMFSPTYRLKAEFQNVEGLNSGAEVRVGGINQGTVIALDLPSQPSGSVTVVMKLRSSTRNLIKADSRAAIKTEGLLGDQYVEVSFGSVNAPDVGDGDTIGSDKPVDMAAQAHEIGDEASQAIEAFRDDMLAVQHNFLLKGFFEKRGYNDTAELTQHAVPHLPAGKPIKEFDYDSEDLFDKPDNAELKDKKRLDDAGNFLQANPQGLAVVASSESKGDSDQDHLLTEARANAVRDYLVQNFSLDDKRLKTIGLGKSKPGDDSSKVAILIYRASAASAPAASATPSHPAPAPLPAH